ncbi:MAG: family 43 glycosylhydrolase, partial [Oscillospiraceae bacterium]|nr:family 43 glycosylhydrolase [Oscillospiraceae bacterium]
MKQRIRFTQRVSAFLTTMVMLMGATTAFPMQKGYAADTVVVNTEKTYQTIKGFGGINHPEWTGQDLTESQRQTAFGNGDDELGLTVLRVFVNPDKDQWYKALPTAQYATKMGVTVFASPWEPPADLAESGGSNGKLHLPKSNYAAYAQHLNDFGTYMKNNNVDLYAISVQNEPDYASEWTYWSTDETTDFIANYGDKITSTRLMSPESFQYAPENASWVPDGGKKFYRKILNNSKAMENCDLFGTHFYGTQRDWMDFPDLENSGKEIWMTEVYVPNSEQDSANRYPEALQVSENIHNAMVVGNMSAYTWWYIRRHYGLMTEDGKISKRGYCMAQYSKYVRPGDVRIDATEQPADNVYVSAYKGDDNQVTIVAINKGTEGYAQNFTISGETISNVDRYRTSANENLAPTLNMEYSENGFYAQLPAESVSTFVITLSEKAEEPNEYGWYFHSTFEGDLDSWSGRGAADVLTSGRTAYVGGESLLVQNRTAAWNGAARALNASAFVPGKEYSFSANVMYFDGDATDQFFLKLQYTDANGDTQYQTIAKGTAIKGEWVQLANKNYKIPEDATNMQIYIETAETTNNFYVDEVIGAVGGTTILGAGESKNIILGDLNFDGVINAVDLCLIKRHYAGTFSDSASKIAADVDQSGEVDATDVKLLQDFLLARITEFPVAEKKVDVVAMEKLFSDITLTTSYKADGENNPLYTQRFGADPGVMEYNGRVYVYTTNDVIEYDSSGNVTENTYAQVNKINCISSDDMVNWTDHGAIPVAGTDGIAKWATCSWAPCAAHKTINGKEKFFLYFCNGGNGVSVLTADSPTGPWSDPLGKALITREVANCSDITWLFDPAVFVDDDGTGYLCFGGGVPDGKTAMPGTSRVVQLGEDMISLAGTP